MRARRPPFTAIAVVLVTTSCGIGGSDRVEEFDPDILARLDEPTSTTTTTTAISATPPPTAPESSPPPTPPFTGGDATTTAAPTTRPETATTVATEPLVLYFIDGEQLARTAIDVPDSTSLRGRLGHLEEGPPAELAERGVRTAMPAGLVRGLAISNDYVTIDLDQELFAGIDQADQRLIVGQIVLTLTDDLGPGFDRVRFTLDDEPLRVFLRDGTLGEPGETVGWSDYSGLLTDADEDDGARTAAVIVDTTVPIRSSGAD